MPNLTADRWHAPDFVRRVAQVCLKNSEYEFVRGGHGDDFVDVDEFYGDNRHLATEEVFSDLVKKVATINEKTSLRALVFIERESGPIGMIAARHKFGEALHIPCLTIRPRKRIRRAWIKGGRIKPGDSVAIVTDVVTTGGTVSEAIRRIVELGGRVTAVVSFADRETGAVESLRQMDVPLEFVYPVSELQAAKREHLVS